MNRTYLLFALVILLLNSIQVSHSDSKLYQHSQSAPAKKGLEVQLLVLPAESEYESCIFEVRLINRDEKTIMVIESVSPDSGLYWKMVNSRGKDIGANLRKYGMPEMARIQATEFVPLGSGQTITRRFRWADEFKDIKGKMDVKLRFNYGIGDANIPEKPEFPVWTTKTYSNDVKLSLTPGKVRVK